ncbi:hypothetical protein SAMN05443247_06607 [Bradyrhizobium erythrophlei]|nr:hypothetical protein SAMN05443247_06607 [Bradyrhizobium erythrophlei]
MSNEIGLGGDSLNLIKELFGSKFTTRGDLATVLIAAPVGFAADIVLTLGGVISPGTFSLLTASAALGAKNAIQAGIEKRKERRSRRPTIPIEQRARTTIDLMRENGLEAEARAIETELQLYKKGVEATDKDLNAAIERATNAYRQKLGHPA